MSCYVYAHLQRFQVGTLLIHLLHVVAACGQWRVVDVVDVFVGQKHGGVQRHAAQLGQGHARKHESVVHFGEVDTGGVQFYVYAQLVGPRGHAFLEHEADVAVERVEQADVARGQPLLGFQRHHLPVSGVDGVNHVLGLVVAQSFGEVFCIVRELVHGHDFAAHEHRLRECHRSEKHVVDVIGHGIFRNQSHGFGHVLSVGTFYRLTRGGVGDEVEFVASGLGVECLGGQHLVRREDGDVALVVHVAAGEVDGWQVGRESFFALVPGCLDFLPGHFHVLVVDKSHGAALLEREGGVLCVGCQADGQCGYNGCCYPHELLMNRVCGYESGASVGRWCKVTENGFVVQ